jgi:YD repeat-containing protein
MGTLTKSLGVMIVGIMLDWNLAISAPVDLSTPSPSLGSANMNGALEIWREVKGVGLQLDKGSYLPLRFKFSSDGTPGAAMLGPGFYCPMFESRSILIRPRVMRVNLPCGKTLYFWGAQSDPTKFQTVDQRWTGSVYGDNFTFWRDDGWKLTYCKSRLSSLITDDGHLFTWDYSASGMPQDVSKDGNHIISVEPNEDGTVRGFVFNSQSYEMQYADRPLMQIVMGQAVVGRLSKALAKYEYPNGEFETFDFGLTEKRVPTLTFTDENKEKTIYSWSAENGHLLSESGPRGDWTYTVGKSVGRFGLPPLARTNEAGRSERLDVDTTTGTYVAKKLDGTTVVTHLFKAPGPLYGKVRDEVQITGTNSKEIYRAAYDDAGRLMRSIDDSGKLTRYFYDSRGKRIYEKVGINPDPVVVASFAAKEKSLLERLKDAAGTKERAYALNDLMIFYTGVAPDYKKAAALLPIMTDKAEIYDLKLSLALNPELLTVERNRELTALIEQFPEKKYYTANLLTKDNGQ